MKPIFSISADLKFLPDDAKSDWGRVFEIRDNPIQDRGGQNKCLNRNPSVLRTSNSVLKVSYCPGTNNPKQYSIDLNSIGVDMNDWFNLMISVARKSDDDGSESNYETKTEDVKDKNQYNNDRNTNVVDKNPNVVGKNTNIVYENQNLVEQSPKYEFKIILAWKNMTMTMPNTPVDFENAQITTNADLYISKKSNVQIRNFETTGMSFITENPSFW